MADPFETEAKAWMEKAWRDLEMAQRAVGVMPPFYDMAVYHCQQSGEKAVKAFLVLRGLVFEKTHDIELLISLAREIEPGFSKLSDAADALTPYATRFRYPAAGSVPHIYTKGAIAYYSRAGWPVCGGGVG